MCFEILHDMTLIYIVIWFCASTEFKANLNEKHHKSSSEK